MKETVKPKAFISWSGGKDGALFFLRAPNEVEISHLLNMITENGEVSRSHGIRTGIMQLQAEATGIPILQARSSWNSYETEFKKAITLLREKGMQTKLKITVYSLALVAFLLAFPITVFSASPERIVSLAPSLTEMICELGMGDKIVAVTDYCDYPPEAVKKPKVGGFSNPSLEMIVSLKPDLVFLTEDGNPKALNDRLRNLGIKTYIFRARRIKELPQAILDLGMALGAPEKARLKAQWLKSELNRFQKEGRKHFEGTRKKAAFIVQPVPLMVAGKETIMDDAFELLGIANIGAAGGKGYPKFSVEEFIRRAPDALFFGKGTRMEERAKPLLEKLNFLPAIRDGRVFFLDEAVYRLGPRIVIVLQEISDSIYH